MTTAQVNLDFTPSNTPWDSCILALSWLQGECKTNHIYYKPFTASAMTTSISILILAFLQGLLLLHYVPSGNSFQIPSRSSHWSRQSFIGRSTGTLGMAQGTPDRRPWNFFRFLQQTSRFMSPFPSPIPSSSASNGVGGYWEEGPVPPGTVLWRPGNSNNDPTTTGTRNNIFTFAPLDDVVMGGVSSSTFDGATGIWKGIVTDANNGGFVGIRSTPLPLNVIQKIDLSRCRGIEWTLAGTDKDMRLKVVLRDSTEFNGVGWTSSKDTTKSPSTSRLKSVVTLKVPFQGQVPCRFAKVISNAPPFDASNVKAFQLVYSKFEYDGALNPKFQTGDFEIQILEIRTY